MAAVGPVWRKMAEYVVWFSCCLELGYVLLENCVDCIFVVCFVLLFWWLKRLDRWYVLGGHCGTRREGLMYEGNAFSSSG